MRSQWRSTFQSAFWAYLACFVAGGDSVGLASYAYQSHGLRSPHHSDLQGLRRLHSAAANRNKPAAEVTAKPASDAREPTVIVLARVNPVEPQEDTREVAAPADADLDGGLTTRVWQPERPDTFRTVCVRLCDGSYTPMSFATTRSRFKADAAKCSASCSSPTRLYHAKAGASELEDMVDMSGERYVDLPNAFKYRTSYDAGCTCRAHPWEEASILRHRGLAAAQSQQSRQPPSAQSAALSTDGAEGPGSMSRRTEAAITSPVLFTGTVRRSLPAEVAASNDLPPQGSAQRPAAPGPSLVQSIGKYARGADASSKAGEKASPKTARVRSAQVKLKHSGEQKGARADWVGRTASRDLRANVSGSARAQREFGSQDFWRMSFWEPR